MQCSNGAQIPVPAGPRLADADDLAVNQTYLDLYFRSHDPAMIGPTRLASTQSCNCRMIQSSRLVVCGRPFYGAFRAGEN